MIKPILVLDWDGTLAFTRLVTARHEQDFESRFVSLITIDRNGIHGKTQLFLRPYAKDFLKRVGQKYNVILWSYGVRRYIHECLKTTNLENLFHKVIVREDMHVPIKDLKLISRDLTRIAIVDDSNVTFGILNPINCIDIPSWSPDEIDDKYLLVLPKVIDFHFNFILPCYNQIELDEVRDSVIRSVQKKRL